MLRFYAHAFLDITEYLSQIKWGIETIRLSGVSLDMPVPTPPAEKSLTWLHNTLTALNLRMSAISAKKMLDALKLENRISAKVLNELNNEVMSRLHDELSLRLLFIISSSRENFYDNVSIWGDEVLIKFPSFIEDIVEAGNCFALNRYTACVFHLMRVMERSVQILGDNLNVPLVNEKVWQTIIGNIRTSLDSKFPNSKDPDRIKYENILGHLETVKIAWRNPTMHPKATYTKEEAEGIIFAVKIFINDLASLVKVL